MLTARDQVEDKVSGFNAGADDYLVKPFCNGRSSAPRLRAPDPPGARRKWPMVLCASAILCSTHAPCASSAKASVVVLSPDFGEDSESP